MSAAMFWRYLPSATRQIPDMSGLPSAAFGAGAARFGFPSGSRGVLGRGRLAHWASSMAIRSAFMFLPYLLPYEPLRVQFVFTNGFHQFVIGKQLEMDRHRPRLRV